MFRQRKIVPKKLQKKIVVTVVDALYAKKEKNI